MFKLVCRTRVRTFRFGVFSLAFGQYCPNLVESLTYLDLRNSIFCFRNYLLNLKMICWKKSLMHVKVEVFLISKYQRISKKYYGYWKIVFDKIPIYKKKTLYMTDGWSSGIWNLELHFCWQISLWICEILNLRWCHILKKNLNFLSNHIHIFQYFFRQMQNFHPTLRRLCSCFYKLVRMAHFKVQFKTLSMVA